MRRPNLAFLALVLVGGLLTDSSVGAGGSRDPGDPSPGGPEMIAATGEAGAQRTGTLSKRATPQLRLRSSSLSDFYFTLRTASPGDSAAAIAHPTRAASARLQALTAYLPDSLALKTQANTILFIHRRNPKYKAAVDRLLWRRLDPTLGTLGRPEELARILPELCASLQPICGPRTDSIRIALTELYKTSYPLYLTSTWPSHRNETSTWIKGIERILLPKEDAALADLSNQLGLPLPDSSQVRFWVVGSGVPEDGAIYPSQDQSYVSIVIPVRESGYRALARALRWYVEGSAILASDSSSTTLRALDRAMRDAKLSPSTQSDLRAHFLDCTVSKTLTHVLDADPAVVLSPSAPSYWEALCAAWNSYLSRATSLDRACAAIVAAAAGATPGQTGNQ